MGIVPRSKPYQLIQEKTGKPLFDAAFVKYYPDTPFCALFQDYPVAVTTIWVCRKVDPQEQNYAFRLATLISHGHGQDKTIGNYIKIFEAVTEKEAEEKLIANLVGTASLRSHMNEE